MKVVLLLLSVVALLSFANAGIGRCATQSFDLRSGPGTWNGIVFTATAQTKLNLLAWSADGQWAQLKATQGPNCGKSGWTNYFPWVECAEGPTTCGSTGGDTPLPPNPGGITQPGTGSNEDSTIRASPQVSTSGLGGIKLTMANIHNSYGGFLQKRASDLGVKVSDLAATLKVESGGAGFENGRMIIRFENHIFYERYTNWGANQDRIRIWNEHFRASGFQDHYFRASVNAPWEKMHDWSAGSTQPLEWRVLQFAQGLDDTTALLSISMGAPQVMGFNYAVEGYGNVQAMFVDFSKSIKAQLNGFITFVEKNSACLNSLRSSNYVGFANCYNGAGQDQYYGNIINEAAQAYRQVTGLP